jgi:hypothetical protein
MLKEFDKLTSGYKGDVNNYFKTIGGHQKFLDIYAEILDANKCGLIQELGKFEGIRYPSDFDVGTPEKTFSWFFHYHNSKKIGKGHFHLYASPKAFNDPTATKKTHLICIELTEDGDLSGFFVPNKWVTDDHVRPTSQIEPILVNFHTFNSDHPDTLNIWISAIITEFDDIILDLLKQRDTFLEQMNLEDRNAYYWNKEIEKICERTFA